MENDAISRSAVIDRIAEFIGPKGLDEWEVMVAIREIIENAPAVEAVPVVHKKDIRSSVITVKDYDEWQDRIILTDESTQVCAVYYADDSERAPVVRCGDCVHAAELEGYPKRRFENGLNCMACRGDNGYGIANLSLTTPDGYCDDGVLRWDGEDE